ncbi:MAG: succinate dehydrogenase, cytochrome b556 subunit [Alphaproteobacteria bacterium]
MSAPAPKAASRPLSPHLSIYKPQLTTGMSIFHRVTGVGLCFALPVLVGWLLALSAGPETYGQFMKCLLSPVGKLFLTGWSWAFCYHLCTGIRHMLWDAGYLLELPQVYASGRIALGVSTILTVFLWLYVWGIA